MPPFAKNVYRYSTQCFTKRTFLQIVFFGSCSLVAFILDIHPENLTQNAPQNNELAQERNVKYQFKALVGLDFCSDWMEPYTLDSKMTL